jgi:hypothetical protein
VKQQGALVIGQAIEAERVEHLAAQGALRTCFLYLFEFFFFSCRRRMAWTSLITDSSSL